MFITGRLILKASSTSDKSHVLKQWVHMLTKVDAVSKVEKVIAAYRLCHDRFEGFVGELSPESIVWPAHHVFIRLFMVFMFFRNCMSAASLPNYLSQLKSCQLDKGIAWLDEPSKHAVSKTMRSLAKMSLKKGVNRKAPMTLAKLRKIGMFLNLAHIKDRQFDALTRTCHNGLLRLGEGVKLRVRDSKWSANRLPVFVAIHDSRANKTGPVEIVELSDWGIESAV